MTGQISEENAAEIAAQISAALDTAVDRVAMMAAILEATFAALRPWPAAYAMAQVVCEHVTAAWPKRGS